MSKYPRSSGVLLPVTMLNGPFGIGTLGAESRAFIDFLSEASFHVWQILPIEHTGTSFSPYKCLSSFAGNPLIIDPLPLHEMGLITAEELAGRADGMSADFVNYELVAVKQWSLLRTAYSRFVGESEDGADFDAAASPLAQISRYKPPWLDTYALYMAIKNRYDNAPWYEWPDEGLRGCDTDAINTAKEELRFDIGFFKFVQYLFSIQWKKLKEYAASRNISIVGDMPFYVSEDSVEVWSARKLFDADINGNFQAVGGAPPDFFTPDGQLWGNPVYNWSLMKSSGYKWWVRRIISAINRYDHVRIDHFRGFDSYWRIPFAAEKASEGTWVKGPGAAVFSAVTAAVGSRDLPLIAEDLGDDHGHVDKLLKKTGLRGMRVMQFGFIGDDRHLPHNITEDFVAYTGTHDNTTLLAWLFELAPEDRERVLFYIGFDGDWTQGGHDSAVMRACIRTLFSTGASLAVVPIQDLLGYGADTRTNIPGTGEGNWRFRVRAEALAQIDTGYYRELNKVTCRNNALS